MPSQVELARVVIHQSLQHRRRLCRNGETEIASTGGMQKNIEETDSREIGTDMMVGKGIIIRDRDTTTGFTATTDGEWLTVGI